MPKITREIKTIIILILVFIVGTPLFFWSLGVLMLLATPGRLVNVIHQVMSHDQYNIIVLSKPKFITLLPNRYIVLEVWSNNKKLHAYRLSQIDDVDEYPERIAGVTIIPESNEIMVEYDNKKTGKNADGVDYFKISEVQNK